MATVERETAESDDLKVLLAALEVHIDEDEFVALTEDELLLSQLHREFEEYLAERRENVDPDIAWLHDTHPIFMLEHWGYTTNENGMEKAY